MADLTPAIQTDQEVALWHNLYCMHTDGQRTDWKAFLVQWNLTAEQHARKGSDAIKPKLIHQLQRFLAVQAALSQTCAPAGTSMQAQQPEQQQPGAPGWDGHPAAAAGAGAFDSTAAAAVAAGAAAGGAGGLYGQAVHYPPPYYQSQQPLMYGGTPYMAQEFSTGYDFAAAGGGSFGGWGSQDLGPGMYNPASQAAAAQAAAVAARARYAQKKQQQSQQPASQPRRAHGPHKCNKC